MRFCLIWTCLAVVLLAPHPGAAEEPGVWLRWRVLDHAGEPVPNVRMRLVAYREDGKAYGDAQDWSTGIGTDVKGIGEMGLTGLAPLKGYLELEARHPAIGTMRKRVEWAQVSRPVPARNEIFELSAMAGPGLAAWRKGVKDAAPELVRRLLAATEEEARTLRAQLIEGESAALPAVMAAAENYGQPMRQRLTATIRAIMNGLKGPVDADVLAKADPVFAVQSFVVIYPEKPRHPPTFILERGQACVKELEWAIAHLTREKQDADLIAVLERTLAQIRKQP